ncbi:GNAT family N-acetyltransferase, partial [Streptomyces asiaticus]
VRIHSEERGGGLGTQLIEWAVEESRREGCALVQLTSDATRIDAHRFYERLGFEASHIGFKLPLA